MAYTRSVHKGYDENNRSIYEVETHGEGVTLNWGQKTYQVMSDIWESGYFATVWNEAENKVETIDWVQSATVDATPEVIEMAIIAERQKIFFQKHDQLTREAWAAVSGLRRGSIARIVRGRKFPIGLEGKVVGFSENQWGTNVGIATSDEMIEVTKNGRTFQNHKDVIWVATRNVERADEPELPTGKLEEILEKATISADAHVAALRKVWK